MPLDLLRGAIEDACHERYNVLSVSGGEPLLYPSLPELLDHAHDNGMVTTVTSNGMLLTPRRLETLAGRADLLAISLDGNPESHNRLRGNNRAFSEMRRHLPALRASGVSFGFVFTLTAANLDELPWAAAFACEQGAKLLQIHPLEETGRAVLRLVGQRPDAQLATIAWVLGRALERQYLGRMLVQVDLVDVGVLQAAPSEVFAEAGPGPTANEVPLAELVAPLVIETDGTVVPLQYGAARHLALGNLNVSRLAVLAERWRREGQPAFRRLCAETLATVAATADLPIVNWFEEFARRAEAPPVSRSPP